MEANINWLVIVALALGAASALRWIWQDIYSFTSKPRLSMSNGPFAANWQSMGSDETKKFVHFEVSSRKGKTAHQCVARAKIIKHPDNVTLLQEVYPLHWADTPYSTVTTDTEPVDIAGEARRLDVAFTTSFHSGQTWLATPMALAAPIKTPQAALPHGEYILEVTVSCEDGRGDTRIIKLVSTNDWEGLRAEVVKRQ